MRLIATSMNLEGRKLGKTIYSDDGKVLLTSGMTLTSRILARLQELGIPLIYVEDELTKDIEIKESITEQTKLKAIKTIKQQFGKLVKDGRLEYPKDDPEFIKTFKSTVYMIIDDLKERLGTLSALTNMYAYDQYTFSHSLHVTVYSLSLAIAKNYSEKRLVEIGMGALLHDIGKLVISREILNKPAPLTAAEYELMKEHTTHGFNLLRSLHEIPLLSAHCAFQHHERMDGTGYPRGLIGQEIHEYARIIAVCDVFDALTSHRAYKQAMTPHMALEVLYTGAGSLYDLEIITLFRDTISMYPIGMMVKLSNGCTAIVVDHNRLQPSRPVVRIIKDQSGQELDYIEEIDLTKNLSIVIEGCENGL